MNTLRFFSCFLLYCCFSANAFSSEISVAVQGNCTVFEVRLPANPTTGYRWDVETFDRERFSLIADNYVAGNVMRMGAPGEHVFYLNKKRI